MQDRRIASTIASHRARLKILTEVQISVLIANWVATRKFCLSILQSIA